MSLIFRTYIISKKEKGTNKYSNLGITLVSEGSKDDCDLKIRNKFQYFPRNLIFLLNPT